MRLQSIQMLRGVAVLGVLVAHAGISGVGVAGVDLFFVISGFVIATIAPGKRPVQFAFDRFWRVFPVYWIFSLPWLILAYANSMDTPLRDLTSVSLLPFEGIPYLRPAWTLMYEVLFYAAALCVLATGRYKWLLATFAACLIWNYFWPHRIIGYFGYPLNINFLLGVLVARQGSVGRNNGVLLILAGVIALLLVPDQSAGAIAKANHETYARAFWWGIPCAMIVWGASSIPGKWPLQKLGDASYAIYLVHMAPAVIFPTWAGVLLSLVFGFAAHYWIELPILKAKPTLFRGSGTPHIRRAGAE